MMILLHTCLNIVCLCQLLMHGYMTALRPCRFRPGHNGDMPLVLYDVFLLVNMQAASLCEHILAISG